MTQEERSLATVSHGISAGAMVLSVGMLGWLVPLIIFYTKRDSSKFIAFHALQSVYLHFGMFLAGLAALVITKVTFGLAGLVLWIPMLLLGILAIAFEVMAAIRANEGKWYGIPVAGQFARRALGDPGY